MLFVQRVRNVNEEEKECTQFCILHTIYSIRFHGGRSFGVLLYMSCVIAITLHACENSIVKPRFLHDDFALSPLTQPAN